MIATEEDIIQGFRGEDVPSESVIRSCVHCGFCLPTCPTYRLTGRERSSPRGRIWLIKEVYEGKMDLLDPIFQDEMSFCLNCRACEAVCPSGVMYGQILEASRAQIETHKPTSLKERALRTLVFRGLFADMGRFRLANRGLRIYQQSGLQTLVRRSRILKLIGLEEPESMMPRLSERFVEPKGQTIPAQGTYRGRVGLFTGCIMSTAYAEVHEATIRVLTRNGFEVSLLAGQQCCGALNVHSGDAQGGRKLARKNIDAYDVPGIDAIIINAAGCGAALKEYGHLLEHDDEYAERAKAFSGRVKDAIEFLAEQGLSAEPGPLPMTVTYQEPCHLAHAQRIMRQPRELLKAIPELKLVEMPESSLCCGSAGIYNLIRPDAASDLLDRKLNNALSTGAEMIVSANPGCMLQMSSGLRARGDNRPVVHLIDLLDRAYSAKSSGKERTAAVATPA